MTPLVHSRIMDALKTGNAFTKREMASTAHCHERTAARELYQLHRDGLVYIASWSRSKGNPLPHYKLQEGKQRRVDAVMPSPLTQAELQAKRRERREIREKEAALKRWDRSVGKDVRIGFWGL